VLIERYTGIPSERIQKFVMNNSVSELMPFANTICKTEAQKKKLTALFEFKSLFETIKNAESNRGYILSSSSTAIDYFRNYYCDLNDKEQFSATFLNFQNRVIATKILFTGTVNESSVYPREIIKEALFYNASSVMIAHNHPGGSLSPSKADIEVTTRMKQSLSIVNIKFLDHIIIAGNGAVSFAEMGIIDLSPDKPSVSKAASPISEYSEKYSLNGKPQSVREQLRAAKVRSAVNQSSQSFEYNNKKTPETKCRPNR